MAGTPGRSGGSNRKSGRLRAHDRRDRRATTPGGPRARPERPAWLVDAVAVEAFERIAELLAERGTVTEGDGDAVLLAALAEAEYRAADALIVAEGLVVNGRPHPAAKIRESAWKRWSTALSRLGLDPITRGRIEPPPRRPKENPFAQFS